MENETFTTFAGSITELGLNEYLIDCDADPFIPEGWSIREKDQLTNRVRGQLKWDLDKVKFLLHPEQEKGVISGRKLHDWLTDKPVYCANVLDYLLANPHLIPEGWKDKRVFFWGTIYHNADGGLDVRYLCWKWGRWVWRYLWIESGWYSHSPCCSARKLNLGTLKTF
jgi:hypothetical protein